MYTSDTFVIMSSSVITARLDDDTLALVDRVARAQGRSRAWFAAQAIRFAAEQEARLLAMIEEGKASIARGDVVPHEKVMARLDEMIAEQEARCR
jgi:predicted transcriptional regulator